jgi:hypothetical protein
VPLFAALTVTLWPACGRRWHVAAALAVAAAALAEWLQGFVGRTPDLADLLRGGAGALAAGVALRAWQRPRTWGRLAAHALAGLALLAWPAAESAPGLLDAHEAHAAFPVLADFATERQSLRWHCRQAAFDRVPSPGRWDARVEFRPGALEPAVRDWAGYRRLCWSFTVEGGPLRLAFSVRDRSSHYDVARTFGPGEHRAELDLAAAAARGREAPLDPSDVRLALVFVVGARSERVVYLHRVWLE